MQRVNHHRALLVRAAAFGTVVGLSHAVPAEGHDTPAAITAVVAADGEGPWLVQLTEGLALRTQAGWRFVCPAMFGIDGGVTLTASAAGGVDAFVVGRDDLYRLQRDGAVVAVGAPEFAGTFVLALATDDASALYGVRLLDAGGTELLRLDAQGPMRLWRDEAVWASIAFFDGELWLAHFSERTLELARVALDGALLERFAFETDLPLRTIQLRAAAGRLFAIATRDADHVLLELGRARFVERWAAADWIAGPIADADRDDSLWILAEGALVALDTGERSAVSEAFVPACLFQAPNERGFACLGTRLAELGPQELEPPFFDLSQLRAPHPVPLDRDTCAQQWQVFGEDLRRAGVVSSETDEVAPRAPPRVALPETSSADARPASCHAAPPIGRSARGVCFVALSYGSVWTLRRMRHRRSSALTARHHGRCEGST